jgi:hypothetical protein
MKKILIVIGVILVVAGVGYFVMLERKASQIQKPTPVTSDQESTSKTSSTYSASVNENTYKEVHYPDPLKKALSAPDEYGNALLAQDKMYMIEYFSKDAVFNITLTGKDLLQSRVAAQGKLLELLGITKEDACKIKTNVGAPFSVNQELSGKNLGLSFCKDSVDLSLTPTSQSK